MKEKKKRENLPFFFRSREVSGQQTSQMFGAGFMSSQGEKSAAVGGDWEEEARPYDADGNAHLEAVLLVRNFFFCSNISVARCFLTV